MSDLAAGNGLGFLPHPLPSPPLPSPPIIRRDPRGREGHRRPCPDPPRSCSTSRLDLHPLRRWPSLLLPASSAPSDHDLGYLLHTGASTAMELRPNLFVSISPPSPHAQTTPMLTPLSRCCNPSAVAMYLVQGFKDPIYLSWTSCCWERRTAMRVAAPTMLLYLWIQGSHLLVMEKLLLGEEYDDAHGEAAAPTLLVPTPWKNDNLQPPQSRCHGSQAVVPPSFLAPETLARGHGDHMHRSQGRSCSAGVFSDTLTKGVWVPIDDMVPIPLLLRGRPPCLLRLMGIHSSSLLPCHDSSRFPLGQSHRRPCASSAVDAALP